jgi:FKBP-type peptidyl-prolyl cis-trans isomerase FklB
MVGAMLATALFASGAQAQAPAPGTAPAAKPAAAAKSDPAAKPAAAKPAATSPAKGAAATMKSPANAKSQASYSIGVSMGEQLHNAGLSPDTIAFERLTQGLRDALAGKAKMSEADQENISNLVRSARASVGDANHATAAAFLADNGKKTDIVTTASGLQYQVVSPGSGASPKPTDEVTVNYRGALLDGTEFDSSYKRGEPASFPVNGVIPGWQEALVLMKPGAKWKLFVPPKLAYDLASPPAIPPGSLLVFDVELIGIKPHVAAPPRPAAPTPAPAPK